MKKKQNIKFINKKRLAKDNNIKYNNIEKYFSEEIKDIKKSNKNIEDIKNKKSNIINKNVNDFNKKEIIIKNYNSNTNLNDFLSNKNKAIKKENSFFVNNKIFTEIKKDKIKKDNEFNYENEIEILKNIINEKDVIIESQKEEIIKLKNEFNDQRKILEEIIDKNNKEINLYKKDLSNIINEIIKLNIEKRYKWIKEQEYKLGKFVNFGLGKKELVWEDGIEISKTKIKLNNIKNEIEKLDNLNNNKNLKELNDSANLIKFRIEKLKKEELKFKEILDKLEIEKLNLIHKSNLFNVEKNSIFFKNKDKISIIDERYQIIEL